MRTMKTNSNPHLLSLLPQPGLWTALLTAGLALLLLCGVAAAEEAEHHPVNFTLYYPVGTNQNPDISTNFRLSLIYGRVGEIRGVDLNAGVSIVQRDVKGLQATLLYSHIGGEFGGIALTGLVNQFQSTAKGIQLAGLANINRGQFVGVQYSPLFNFVQGGLKGIQLTSVFNVNAGRGGFLQLSGVANSNDGEFRGAQIASLNLTTARLSGLQVGIANLTDELNGGQAGLINMAREARGLQLGALNMAHDNEGIPVGFINIDETDGKVDWTIAGSNLAAISTGVKTEVNNWYSMLTLGYGDLQGDVEETFILGWNYGYAFRLGRAWNLGVDLGYLHFIPETQDDPTLNDSLHFAVQLRALLELRLSSKLALFAGGGVSSIYSAYSSNAQQETEPHVVLGVSLF